MKKAVIILSNIIDIPTEYLKNSLIIGADRGALNAIMKGIKLDIAIGDFDSVNENEFNIIKDNSLKYIKLNPVKDYSDTKEAVDLVSDYDEITILGGIKGNRIEHFIANLMLISTNNKITMIDDNSKIVVKDKSFKPDIDYKFISFYSLDDKTVISLTGFKYNLSNYNLLRKDPLCLSNEIISNPYVDIKSGKLIVIYSKNN